MVLKNISPGCGVRASLMLFFDACVFFLSLKVKVPDTSQEVTFLAPGHMVPTVPTTAETESKKEQRKRKKSVDVWLVFTVYLV